ncbi:phosphogluconate dehydratase [Aquisalinus flavus]|uniref:Phosphogluconate dehydratase n=1 Tax=Aquisalinus flavus TaxID=1526572 RepID=A0A8J2V3N6_9PROT|nr:phosphogluconate dehydratase [Aquisalinus flavus]MBD0427043.1 phosphogluconate dehydratase [Aquisalinus flavus]UNE46869.1 phosphogluconate dehydratase [Aquisalinus flavus]GGC97931.1 phosphogluconate dehydratase [Aquisalinus flavus]
MSDRLHPVIAEVTDRIQERSRKSRESYVSLMKKAAAEGPSRNDISCGNLAHAIAGCPDEDKQALMHGDNINVGIVNSYNDMLSAHQPLGTYPDIIKKALREVGAVGQVAGGVPAMCDGVTQGEPGMELSLFSRDVIAMATAISLSHNVFDAALCLGVCDKIVPGLMIGALRFGHLPFVFVPAGPMPSGLPNKEKVRIRQLYAEGKIGQKELLEAESASYHSPGTCTFYGTANSNQMLMEVMGVHLPGSAFINPGTPLREAMTAASARRVAEITKHGNEYTPLYEVVDERSIVNAMIGLNATGGSTNHTIHLVAIARAAGIIIDWDDFSELSGVTPLLCRVYPNGPADVNHFAQAGGLPFMMRELMENGLLHTDVNTVSRGGMEDYKSEPFLKDGKLHWVEAEKESKDESIVRPYAKPFQPSGGLQVLSGNIGRAVIKISAVNPEHQKVTAPAIVFDSQADLLARFKAGELECDFIAVVRNQGPGANGMPELHKLTPPLGVIQDKGYKVALVTDGRMSGASGKVPAAIHLSPETVKGGIIGKIRDGDMITLDAVNGVLSVDVSDEELTAREAPPSDIIANETGMGRELFAGMRQVASTAETGAITFASAVAF